MIPCLLVDTVRNAYLVCRYRARALTNVFGDGVEIGSGFAVEPYVARNGRLYTLIRFFQSQGGKAIMCDGEGYDTVGDGTGPLLDNPADVLAHLLKTVVFGDHAGVGRWPGDEAAPIDTALFARARGYFADHAYSASRRLSEPIRAMDLVSEWAFNHQARVFWTMAGKIGIAVDDPATRDVYPETWLRWYGHEIGQPLRMKPSARDAVRRIQGRYCFGEAAQKYFLNLEVVNPGVTVESSQTVDLPWSPAYL